MGLKGLSFSAILQLEFLKLKMKFLLAVVVLTIVGAHAASDIVVKVDEEELSPLLRLMLLKNLILLNIEKRIGSHLKDHIHYTLTKEIFSNYPKDDNNSELSYLQNFLLWVRAAAVC